MASLQELPAMFWEVEVQGKEGFSSGVVELRRMLPQVRRRRPRMIIMLPRIFLSVLFGFFLVLLAIG